MTKIEVGDTVEITEGVLKGFQAKVTDVTHGVLRLGSRMSYSIFPGRVKLVKKAKAVKHVYVVFECSSMDLNINGVIHGVYSTDDAAYVKANRIDTFAHIAVLRMTLKGV